MQLNSAVFMILVRNFRLYHLHDRRFSCS